MRFIIAFLTLILLLFTQPAQAIEEVILDIEGETDDNVSPDLITDEEWYFDMGGKSLQEKLREKGVKIHFSEL